MTSTVTAGEALRVLPVGPGTAPLRIDDREELVYLLNEAAELEHAACCSYLFAAFSLKTEATEGLTDSQLRTVRDWKRTLMGIAVQEMSHLALVTNLLSAIGAAPHFERPNFPMRSPYAPEFQFLLTSLDEEAIERFLYIERPEGMDISTLAGKLTKEQLQLSLDGDTLIMPAEQDFSSVGQLYRGIEAGLVRLTERLGEDWLFVGTRNSQATRVQFRLPELIPVTDLASARSAINTIVAEGEGLRGNWRTAHFGRFVAMLESYRALRHEDPGFEPARPVVSNPYPRLPLGPGVSGVTVLTDPTARAVAELFDGAYEVMLQALDRLFVHLEETDAELGILSDIAIEIMSEILAPLGELLTHLPAGPEHVAQTAGASFSVNSRTVVSPHKRPAWFILRERLLELARWCSAPELANVKGETMASVETAFARLGSRVSLSGNSGKEA